MVVLGPGSTELYLCTPPCLTQTTFSIFMQRNGSAIAHSQAFSYHKARFNTCAERIDVLHFVRVILAWVKTFHALHSLRIVRITDLPVLVKVRKCCSSFQSGEIWKRTWSPIAWIFCCIWELRRSRLSRVLLIEVQIIRISLFGGVLLIVESAIEGIWVSRSNFSTLTFR